MVTFSDLKAYIKVKVVEKLSKKSIITHVLISFLLSLDFVLKSSELPKLDQAIFKQLEDSLRTFWRNKKNVSEHYDTQRSLMKKVNFLI